MLTPFQFPNYGENIDDDENSTSIMSIRTNITSSTNIATVSCTQCLNRNVICDRSRPTCSECINNTLYCHYQMSSTATPTMTNAMAASTTISNSTVAVLRQQQQQNPNEIRDMETRLKKMENQLLVRTQPSSPSTPPFQKQEDHHQKKKSHPRFGLEPAMGGLCIETEITEAHHFIKLLFSTINVEKIQHIAHHVFAAHLKRSIGGTGTRDEEHHKNNNVEVMHQKPPHLLMDDLLKQNDGVEQQWLHMIITTQLHRCMILYQCVNTNFSASTDYLQHFQGPERTRELLLAMALRAYIYHHEDELHQDIEFPVRTPMGPVYFKCALALLEECYTISHRTTIRALLYLFLYHLHDKTEEAFPYCDLAIRMAQDLNLHQKQRYRERENHEKHGYTTEQLRMEDDRRLWWATYWCQLYTIVEYNRPTVFEDDAIEVPMPHVLSFENTDVGCCIDYCVMSIKLLRLRRSIAAALKTTETTHILLYQVRDLETALDDWYTILPEHAKLETTEKNQKAEDSQQDPLCTELGLLLHAQYYSTKLQMYECFLNNATALSLVAVRNCEKAAAGITDMLVHHGATMRMCSCVRIVPTLHRCVAMLISNAEFKDSEAIASDAVERLRMLGSVLRCHSFKYVQEIAPVIRLIDNTLRSYPTKLPTKPPKPIAPAATAAAAANLQPTPSISSPMDHASASAEQQKVRNHHGTSLAPNGFAHAPTSVQQQQQDESSLLSYTQDTTMPVIKQQPLDTATPPQQTPTQSQSTNKKRQRQQSLSATQPISNDQQSGLPSSSTSADYQMQQMSTQIPTPSGFNIGSLAEQQMMNAYQSMIPLPSSSLMTNNGSANALMTSQQPEQNLMASMAYTSAVPLPSSTSTISNNTSSIASFPPPSSTLQQPTDQAWTASVPMNPNTLALLGITNNDPSMSSQHNIPYIPSQQNFIPSRTVASTLPTPALPYQNSIYAPFHSNSEQQQQPKTSTSTNTTAALPNRTAPFSRGSIFHRAPAPPRPSNTTSPPPPSNNVTEDPYLTKFPIIAPPIVSSTIFQQQQQPPIATITELPPNLITDDSSNTSQSGNANFEGTASNSSMSSSQRRRTQSPQTDTSSQYGMTTPFYPWPSPTDMDGLSSSSSSQHERPSPGVQPPPPQQQHHYFS